MLPKSLCSLLTECAKQVNELLYAPRFANKIDLFAIDCKDKMQSIANLLLYVVNKVLRVCNVGYIGVGR